VSGSGMIIETNARPSQKASGIRIGAPAPSTANCRENEMLFPFYRNSFRSGSSFNSLSGNNYTSSQMADQTLIENLLRTTGTDIGHEYERRRVTEIFSSFHRKSGISTTIDSKFLPRSFVVPYGTGLLDANGIYNFITSNVSYVTDATLISEGTRLINLTNPLKPPVNLAVDLSEMLFDGLPKNLGHALLGSAPNKRELVRALGSDYLNYMFGITPVVKDIDSLVRILRKSASIIDTWKKNDGRQVRRRRAWTLPDQLTAYNKTLSTQLSVAAIVPTSASNHAAMPTNLSSFENWTGSIESNTVTSTQYSFSSTFEYQLDQLIPEYPEPIRSLMFGGYSNEAIVDALLLMRQFGLDPKSINSPSTYWNVLPYTWLLDWFVNTGDLMSSITAFQTQGLKLTYGYMSAHQVSRFSADYRFTAASSVYEGSVSITSKRDRRIRATPYGFGTTFTGLNSVQLSLLAALATSRKRT